MATPVIEVEGTPAQFAVTNAPQIAAYASVVWDGVDNSNNTATNLLDVDLTQYGGFAFNFNASTDISNYWQIYVYPHGGSLANAASYTFFIDGTLGQTFVEYFILFESFTNYNLNTFQHAGAIEFFADNAANVNDAMTLVQIFGYDINGFVFFNCNGSTAQGTAVSGINVTLTNNATGVVYSTNVTDSSGFWTLAGPPANNTAYTVCVNFAAPYLSEGVTCQTITLVLGNDYTGINFAVAQAPTIVAPSATSVPCGTNITVGAPGFVNPTVTGGCPYTVAVSDFSSGTSCSQVVTRTWTYTSVTSGLFSQSVSQTITFTYASPSFSGFPSNYQTSCNDSYAPSVAGQPNATAQCGNSITSINSVDSVGSFACNQTVTRTWTAIDSCGHTAQRNQMIYVIYNVPPFFSFFPSTFNRSCGFDPNNLTLTGTPTVSSPCIGPTATYSFSTTTTGTSCNQMYNRTFVGTDSCGNQVIQSQTIIAYDSLAPAITSFPPDRSGLACGSSVSTSVLGSPTATDACNNGVNVGFVDTYSNLTCSDTITRTFTISDNCGNKVTQNQSITVNNAETPVFTSLPSNQSIPCTSFNANLSTFGSANASDCSIGASITTSNTTTTNACSVTVTRKFVASDVCGNSATAFQIIDFHDVTPSFSFFPNNYSTNCQSSHNTSVAGTPIPFSPCNNGSVSISSSDSPAGPGCNQTITRAWTVADGCLSFTQNQYLFITDSTAPSFATFPVNVSGQCGALVLNPSPTASDVCGNKVSLSSSSISTGSSCNRTTFITWTATNPCGVSATQVQEVNLVDSLPPTFKTFHNMTTISCLESNSTSITGFPTLQDCQTNPLFYYNDTISANTTCSTTINRTFTAYDGCGNSATQSQIIYQNDTFSASFTNFPTSASLTCGSNISSALLGQPGATTPCGKVAIVSYTDIYLSNTTCLVSIQRQWQATTACGATIFQNQSIQLIDGTPPTFGSFPPDITLNCTTPPTLANTGGSPTITDNCSPTVPTNYTDQTTVQSCQNITTRTFFIADICGNKNSRSQQITVSLAANISITSLPPSTQNLSCNANTSTALLGTITASDACFIPTIRYSDAPSGNNCNRLITRTFTASDSCNVPQNFVQSIYLVDSQPPSLSLPADTTVPCNSTRPTSLTGTATAVDACNPGGPITFVDISNNLPCTPTYTREWKAADICGNSVSGNQTIFTSNPFTPVFTFFPANVSVSCENKSVSSTGVPTATDPCGTLSAPTSSDGTFGTSCLGGTHRLWKQCDSCGKCTSQTQTITFYDNAGPVFPYFPPTMTFQCSQSTTPVLGTPAYPTASDVCNIVESLTYTDASPPNPGCTYVINRTWTAVDSCGNPTSQTQTINIINTINPTFPSFPSDLAIPCTSGFNTNASSTGTPTGSDNCDNTPKITFVDQNLSPQCPSGITIQRTWTITDICGNHFSQPQLINVTLSTPPITIPANVNQNCDVSISPSSIGYATSVSPCNLVNIVNYTDAIQPGSCPQVILRTWTATDPCGNQNSGVQTITLSDKEAPFFSYFPQDIQIGCAQCSSPNCTGLPIASDKCNNLLCGVDSFDFYLTGSVEPGACAPDTIIIRQFTVTDTCGNAVSKNQTITIANEEFNGNCPQQNCPAEPCTTDLCPTVINIGCDCCAQGGIKSCNSVPCTPVACDPVECNAVPCTPCNEINQNYFNNQINNLGTTIVVNATNPPICDSSVDVPCVPQIVYVVRASNSSQVSQASPSPSPINQNQTTRQQASPSAGVLVEASPIILAIALLALILNFIRFD